MSRPSKQLRSFRRRIAGEAWVNTTKAPLRYRIERGIELVPEVFLLLAFAGLLAVALLVAILNGWL
jgi:hypothetical protein